MNRRTFLTEEVDRADIELDRGGNFGWNIKEGTFLFDAGPPPSPRGELRIGVTANSPGSPLVLIDPLVQNDHGSNGEGSAVIGGFTYQQGRRQHARAQAPQRGRATAPTSRPSALQRPQSRRQPPFQDLRPADKMTRV